VVNQRGPTELFENGGSRKFLVGQITPPDSREWTDIFAICDSRPTLNGKSNISTNPCVNDSCDLGVNAIYLGIRDKLILENKVN